MSKKSEAVREWRKNTKKRIVKSMGGKCCICGYDKCFRSLDLHHLDPNKKEIGIGQIMANPTKWQKIVLELKKCVLLCSNCHGEYHDGVVEIPKDAPSFDKKYEKGYCRNKQNFSKCPVCGTMKPSYNITCSRACSSKRTGKIDWSSIDIRALRNEGLTWTDIGDKIGVSAAAVHKRGKWFERKKTEKTKKECLYCNEFFMSKRSTAKYCSDRCKSKYHRKVQDRPSKEELSGMIDTMSWVAIARKYGVSDTAVRKWARNYGIVV